MLVSLLIVGILASILVFGYDRILRRSEVARCMSNMKSLQVALNGYVQDRGHWPQEPLPIWEANNADAYEKWWIEELRPYGVAEKSWQCPTIVRRIMNKTKDGRPRIHYTPTMFDEKPFTPYKWSTQPWLIEIGNMHGKGALICYPDGSIKELNAVIGGKSN